MTFELVKQDSLLPLCKCGCGERVPTLKHKWLPGHSPHPPAGKKTAMRSLTTAKIDDNGDIIFDQNMELAQQIIGKALKNAGNNHSINIITVLNSTTTNGNGKPQPIKQVSTEPISTETAFYERLAQFETLDEVLTEILGYARENGLLPGEDINARIQWLTSAERVLAYEKRQ